MSARVVWLLGLVGCTTTLPDHTPYVKRPRVLAIRAHPAEVSPGDPVELTALDADGSGERSGADLDWAFCMHPKPLAELGPVASTCLDPESADLEGQGSGASVEVTVPEDACSRFGPNPPPAEDGSVGGRPADPDATGGFYQPVLVFDGGRATLGSVRLRCGPANVDQETFVAWNQAYRSNEAPTPTLTSPRWSLPDSRSASTSSWPPCAEDEVCAGAETYVVYDLVTTDLETRREALSATWFATDGRFRYARDGRAGDDLATDAANRWTAPDREGEVWLAVVLRDERGGVGFASARVEVSQ